MFETSFSQFRSFVVYDMEVTPRPKGKIIHSKEREIIRNIVACCDKEAKDKDLLIPIAKATDRACKYANVSRNVIIDIRKHIKTSPEVPLKTPTKSKNKSYPTRKAFIDNFDRDVIRQTIEDFYLVQKVVPSVSKLLPVLKNKIDFHWSKETLRRVLHEMGFTWKKCASKRLFLIERRDIVNWRCQYLTQMRQFRLEKRNIFYIDETWIDTNLTFDKCWQGPHVTGVMSNHSSSNRLIVVHIGSSNGFLPGSSLIFKAGTSSGDYHGQMNSNNFEKWIREKVVPNLPESSIIVMDNAPYHNKQVDKPPSKYSVKSEMIDWLQRKGINCDSSMRKTVLYQLVEKLMPATKVYRIDSSLQAHGHTVLRLPPYMCELNPIEFAWAKIKYYIREHNTSGDMSLTRLQELSADAVNAVTANDWTGFTKKVIQKEDYYWNRDFVVEEAIDSVVVNIASDNSDSENDFDEESDDDNIVEDQDSEILATPLDG